MNYTISSGTAAKHADVVEDMIKRITLFVGSGGVFFRWGGVEWFSGINCVRLYNVAYIVTTLCFMETTNTATVSETTYTNGKSSTTQ